MQWASAISEEQELPAALAQLSESIAEGLNGKTPDLAIVFVSPHFQGSYKEIPDLIFDLLSPNVLIGCSAGGVIGGGVEVEGMPALSITVASLPDVDLHTFHLERGELPSPDAGPSAWVDALGVPRDPTSHLILLVDPYTFDPTGFFMGLDFAYPDGAKIGGFASAQGANALFLNRDLFQSGAIGVALQGNITVDTIVAQGCRPIGTPLKITNCQRHYLLEVDDKPPLDVLSELYQSLPPEDQELMGLPSSLFLGIATTEFQDEYSQGDFLIRQLAGIDQEKGTLTIGELLQNGQTVQFHLRDAKTSAEDLNLMLSRYQKATADVSANGVLLFSCNGRGRNLYGHSNHDSDAFAKVLGNIPLGGFFCAGEIGPVGSSTHLHSYTSSFGIFKPLSE